MRKKVYGDYRVDACPFCGKQATVSNPQGVPTCLNHKSNTLQNLKCACGGWLDILKGKFGPFFHCMNCGNVSFNRGLEMNPQVVKQEKKEVTLRSDEVDFI